MDRLYQANPAVESAPLNEEEILFHGATNKFAMLNSTSRFLWKQLSEPKTSSQLAEELCGSFRGASPAQALPDVEEALRLLGSLDLVVEPTEGPRPVGAGASRETADGGDASYSAPLVRAMTEDEVLVAFQMTAAEISAAGCWWSACASPCP